MGISYSVDRNSYDGHLSREVKLTGSFDASYNSGGEALNPAHAKVGKIDDVVLMDSVTESGYVVSYDQANGTLKVYEGGGAGATLSEVAGGTDISTESVTLLVRGRGSP